MSRMMNGVIPHSLNIEIDLMLQFINIIMLHDELILKMLHSLTRLKAGVLLGYFTEAGFHHFDLFIIKLQSFAPEAVVIAHIGYTSVSHNICFNQSYLSDLLLYMTCIKNRNDKFQKWQKKSPVYNGAPAIVDNMLIKLYQPFFTSLAQASFNPTVRLKMS